MIVGAAVLALGACLAATAVAALGGVALGGTSLGVSGQASVQLSGVSARATSEIPPAYLSLYRLAAAHYGVDWAILAGIGKVECDHGRDSDPSCTQEGAVNSAGAGGPMQFLASTWSTYGVDGDGDNHADRWDAADAIYSAANYLRAAGAPADYRDAIFTYNHATWYVNEVEHWAALYRATGATLSLGEEPQTAGVGLAEKTSTPVRFIPGTQAELSPEDGHVALIPAGAPPVVQAMLVAGNELQDLPYGPDGHPDPRGASDEDCSSSINYVFYRSGVRPIAEILRENPLAQDYVHWGAPGPGRWVTIYATDEPPPHVFAVIAGLRLDTSGNGTDVGPNRGEGGPRWRILDHIPSWAHWSVRHPPGL